MFDRRASSMVLLDHVTKMSPGRDPQVIFAEMTAALRTDSVVAILGRTSSGKTTLLQLLAGAEPADGGHIATRVKFSMILNGKSFLYPGMTGLENAEMLARIYAMPPKLMAEQAVCMPGIGQAAWIEPVGTLLPRTRRTLEIMLAGLLPYDCYLLDDFERIEPNIATSFINLVGARGCGILFTTYNTKAARQFAQSAAVIANRALRLFGTVKEAEVFYDE